MNNDQAIIKQFRKKFGGINMQIMMDVNGVAKYTKIELEQFILDAIHQTREEERKRTITETLMIVTDAQKKYFPFQENPEEIVSLQKELSDLKQNKK